MISSLYYNAIARETQPVVGLWPKGDWQKAGFGKFLTPRKCQRINSKDSERGQASRFPWQWLFCWRHIWNSSRASKGKSSRPMPQPCLSLDGLHQSIPVRIVSRRGWKRNWIPHFCPRLHRWMQSRIDHRGQKRAPKIIPWDIVG